MIIQILTTTLFQKTRETTTIQSIVQSETRSLVEVAHRSWPRPDSALYLRSNQSNDMTDEKLYRCVVNLQDRSFYLYSDQGSKKTVVCETMEEFMNVLEVVRDRCDEDALSYASPKWDLKQEKRWKCCSLQSGIFLKQRRIVD